MRDGGVSIGRLGSGTANSFSIVQLGSGSRQLAFLEIAAGEETEQLEK
jgi:hypothetical protein